MRILVLSPYQACSHRLWIEQLVRGLEALAGRYRELFSSTA